MPSIEQRHLVLLPGLDGTGELLGPFLDALPPQYSTAIVRYPRDKALNYRQLVPYIREALPWGKSYTLVAESFFGPLAFQFVEEQPQDMKAIVLVSTFLSNPIPPPKFMDKLLKKELHKMPPSLEYIKKYWAGEDAPDAFVNGVLKTFQTVSPEVLDFRFQMGIQDDSRTRVALCRKPLLYLAGNQDAFLGPKAAEEISTVQPRTEVVHLDAPHLILQRRPREAVTYIDNFLDLNCGIPLGLCA